MSTATKTNKKTNEKTKWTFQKYVGSVSFNNLQIAVYSNNDRTELKLIKEDMLNIRNNKAIFMSLAKYAQLIDESDERMESGLIFLTSLLNRYFDCDI